MNEHDGQGVLVRARGVGHAFTSEGRARVVVSDVDLDLGAGEFVALTGPSGAGKTTLLTLVGALRRLQQGTLEVDGVELGRLDRHGSNRLRRRIGFIFQDHHLFHSLTAEQTLVVTMRLHAGRYSRQDYRQRPRAWLERLGLGGHLEHRPAHLSTGQKQR
ncbi:MAG TPA: ATP-binding cassette domain-containing protein, partial [Gammaproteobacteria bacterium]